MHAVLVGHADPSPVVRSGSKATLHVLADGNVFGLNEVAEFNVARHLIRRPWGFDVVVKIIENNVGAVGTARDDQVDLKATSRQVQHEIGINAVVDHFCLIVLGH